MIYLIWERESYCDYDVIFITQDKEKAEKMIEELNSKYESERYWIDEKELNELTKGRW